MARSGISANARIVKRRDFTYAFKTIDEHVPNEASDPEAKPSKGMP